MILVHAKDCLFVWLLDNNLEQLREPEKWGPKQSNRCRLFLNPSDLKTGLNLQNTRVLGCLVLISWLFACLLTVYGCRDDNRYYFHCKPTADASNGPLINIFDPHRFRRRLLMAAEKRRKTCLAAPVRPGCWHLSASCMWVIKRSSVTIRRKKLQKCCWK